MSRYLEVFLILPSEIKGKRSLFCFCFLQSMTFKSKCACEDGCTYPENPSSHRLSMGSILLIVWVWNNFIPDENNVEKSEQQKYPHSQKCHNTVKEQVKWLRRILEFQSTIHIPLLTLMRRLLAWSVCLRIFFNPRLPRWTGFCQSERTSTFSYHFVPHSTVPPYFRFS